VHIILSILAFSVLVLSGLQALVIYYQHQQLHAQRPQRLAQGLPPLETMENVLFHLIRLGFLLLSLSLVSGFIYLQHHHAHWPMEKIGLSVFAWLIFAIVLLGRHYWGLRGKRALQATWLGLGLLVLGYFVSRFFS